MPLSPEDLQDIATRTLAHYEQHAQSYREGTRDHDVSQNIAALLQHMPGLPPFDLLDFGCNPGRDLQTFKGGTDQLPSRWPAGQRGAFMSLLSDEGHCTWTAHAAGSGDGEMKCQEAR